MYFQQGDQTFHKVQKQPNAAHAVDDGVLVKSPVTGHAHRAESGKVWQCDDTGDLFVVGPAKIVHEEHDPIEIPEGIWKMDTVQEFDHLTEETRNVVD